MVNQRKGKRGESESPRRRKKDPSAEAAPDTSSTALKGLANLVRQLREQRELVQRQNEALRVSEEELRIQNEELQTAEEELRAQNEELRVMQDELRDARDRYFDFYDLAPAGYLILERSGTVVEVNTTAVGLLGENKATLAGRKVSVFLAPESAGDFSRHHRQLLKTGQKQAATVQMRRGDGTTFWAGLYSSLAPDGQTWRMSLRDVTERVQAEQALQQSNRNFSALFNNRTVGLAYGQTVFDDHNRAVDYVVLDINPTYESMTGIKRKQIVGKRITEAAPGVAQDLIDRHNRVAVTGEETRFEIYDHVTARWYDVNVFSPQKGYFIALFSNVTERKRIGEALKESEERFVLLFEKVQYAVTLVSLPDGIITNVNQAWERLFGYTRQEAVGKTSLELGVNPDIATCKHVFAAVQEKGFVRDVEASFTTKSGRTIIVSINSDTVEIGGHKYMLSSLQDITERKQTEAELARHRDHLEELVAERTNQLLESETNYRRLVETASEGVSILDKRGVSTYCNKRFAEMFGYLPEDLVGKPLRKLVDRAWWGELAARWKHRRGGLRETYELGYRHKDGHLVYCRVSAVPVYGRAGEFAGSFALVTDITGDKQTERELLLRAELLNTATDGIYLRDTEGKFVYFNDTFCRLYGYSRGEMANLNIFDLIAPHRLAFYADVNRTIMESGEATFENVHRRKDGSLMPVEIHARRVEIGGQPNVLIAIRDISRRKQAEEEMHGLRLRLMESQEVERRNIARELHDGTAQYLTALRIALERARHSPADNTDALNKALATTTDLIKQIRDLSLRLRPAMLDDLGLLPALITHFERYTQETGIEVDFHHEGISGDIPPQLRTAVYRVVQESLTNVARYAGVKRVSAAVTCDGKTIFIRIEDRGKGFDPQEARGRPSTGLGGMRERIELLGGRFDLTTAPGQGTCITAEVPLAVDAPGTPGNGI